MRVNHQKIIDCSTMEAEACSDMVLDALGHGPTFKLKADTPDDTVHGSVTIAHNLPPEPHKISVEVYEDANLPALTMINGVTQGRRSTLQRPAIMPTAKKIRDRLNAWTAP